MAKRYIGDTVVTIAYNDHGDYRGTVSASGRTWRFADLHPPKMGFNFGYDSPEAYDEMAKSAASFGSYYSSSNRGDDTPDWAPDPETADAIDEAVSWAQDESGKYEVRRSPKGPAREEARINESRRAPDNRSAYDFFKKNAGGRVGHSAEDAWALALAEAEAHRRGWHVEWKDDPEGWDSLGDIDPDTVKEVLSAILRDSEGNVLGSLGSIVDPDRSYGRVVEAELALEALSNEGWVPSRQRSSAREASRVADFNTLPELVKHARTEGATHTMGTGPQTKIYFSRGDGQYEEATVWKKESYWHAQGPGSRTVVRRLPAGAVPITSQTSRRAAEVREADTAATAFKHLLPGTRFKFADPQDAGPSGFGREDWTWIKIGHNTYRNPLAPQGRKYEHRTGPNTQVLPERNEPLRESPIARDYIAVDRNDRRVAGPFRSRGEAEGHVPPGGYVKFSSAQHRRAPPPPSSYPMFRARASKPKR